MPASETKTKEGSAESFPEALRKLRDEAGYPSARAFYKHFGGRSYFRCTYRQYLNIESGMEGFDAGSV